jgi:uncharacterized RDD family membrane protein YckC
MSRFFQSAVATLCATIALVASARVAAAADGDTVLAHGTDQMYWVAIVSPPRSTSGPSALVGGATSESARSVVQARTNGGQRWHVLAKLDAPVLGMSHRADSVAVLLGNGQWMLLWSGGGAVGKPLPGRMQMLALGGSSDALWAVGQGNLDALPPPSTQPTTSIAALTSDSQERPSTRAGSITAPVTAPATATMPAARTALGLFEFVGNAWILRAALPDEFDADASSDVSLTVAGSRPMLAVRDREHALHVLSLDREGRLSDLGKVQRATSPQSFKLLGSGQPVLLWAATGSPAGMIWRVDQLSAAPKALVAPAKFAAGSPMVLASALGSIRLLFQRDGATWEQTYSMAGEPRGEAQPLPLSDAAPAERFPEWLMLPVLLLLVFLLFGPTRRRELTLASRMSQASDRPAPRSSEAGEVSDAARPATVATDESRPGPLLIAPTRLRFTAGVVDALPVIILSFYIAATVQSAPPEEFTDIVYSWRWFSGAAMAVYLLHTTLSELFTGRTFGKWIFGLRVVSLDGGRPGVAAILVRNILRLIDFNLLFPLLLVVVMPYHQRLGDIAARTVVVAEDWEGEDEEE